MQTGKHECPAKTKKLIRYPRYELKQLSYLKLMVSKVSSLETSKRNERPVLDNSGPSRARN